MKSQNKKRVVLVLVLILPSSVLLMVKLLSDDFLPTLSYVGPRTVNTEILDNGETQYDTSYYKVPEFSMTNQDGEIINTDSLLGKYYVASFFFTSCPSVCPALNFRLKQVSEKFKFYEEFYLVSFSVDPNRDSVEVLKNYAKELNVLDRNWLFLNGDQDRTHELASGFLLGANEDSEADGGFYHAEGVVIVDWNGHIRSRIGEDGNIYGSYDVSDPNKLRDLKDDLKLMKAEYEVWNHNLEDGK